ncbi:hypothetical protein [Alteriqipengyuania sp.]|uniref:hypothetical protein n=1 Tax=Alteriqipengyuania sp. TaxID=2800692 RepID=UPI0035143EB2
MHRIAIALIFWLAILATPAAAKDPRNFIYTGAGELQARIDLLDRPDIEGAQVVYTWRMLEPEKGEYDFSAIEADLALTNARGKDLFAQIQDRFFLPTARHVPQYILDDPEYDGGLARQYDNPGEGEPVGQGWTAMHWNPAVRARFQALLAALGERFDGRILGVNLPESSFDPLAQDGDENGFTCDAYFDALLDNMRAARAAFGETHVVQYLNFWPCEWDNDHRYMERAFALAVEQGIGAGGPDIVPHRRAQMKNSYPFFNRHKDDLPLIAMAIQEPTLTYTNPETGAKFTREEFVAFARDYLGVDIIFWSVEAPWLAAE